MGVSRRNIKETVPNISQVRLALPLLTVSWIKNRLGLTTSPHLFTNRLSRHWECRRVTCFEIVFILFCHFILKPALVHIHQMNTMGVKCGITVVDSALMPLCPAEIFGLHGQKEKMFSVCQTISLYFCFILTQKLQSLFISVVIFMNEKDLSRVFYQIFIFISTPVYVTEKGCCHFQVLFSATVDENVLLRKALIENILNIFISIYFCWICASGRNFDVCLTFLTGVCHFMDFDMVVFNTSCIVYCHSISFFSLTLQVTTHFPITVQYMGLLFLIESAGMNVYV